MTRSALVAHPAAEIYELIVDVERYPQFLPWCVDARLQERSEGSMLASLSIRRGPLRTQFTTRNTLQRDRSVGMSLVSGPFRNLEGAWTLTPLGEDGCRVELKMRFEFSAAVPATLLEPVFEETAASLVDAFVARAREVYAR